MRFSYSLIKKLSSVKSKKDLIAKLNLYSCEAEDLREDTVDISVPPNRYSDLASHFGIAREISVIYGKNNKIPKTKFQKNSKTQNFKVEVEDKKLCPRYMGQYFDGIKVKSSPKWMQSVLKSCGLKPINNVVDVMNYVMFETGQPLHVFDFDKIEDMKILNLKSEILNKSKIQSQKSKTIIIRRAKKNEQITTLDNETFELNTNVLVIADSKKPLAIAGIKGGKKAEVNSKTKRIIVEAANFDAVNIYKSSKALGLTTDASARFSRNLSPELAAMGINRAAELLKETIGAKAGGVIDIYPKKQPRKIIKFDIERFNKFIGIGLDIKTASDYLKRLEFKITKSQKLKTKNSFFVEVPKTRLDIETFEDLAEEVIRLYGYNKLKPKPPHIHLIPSGFEDEIVLKNKVRKVLVGFGLDEVYNYSFISQTNVDSTQTNADSPRGSASSPRKSALIELENPISREFKYLRPSLVANLLKNISANFRFFDDIKIFEIGKVFQSQEVRPLKIERNVRRSNLPNINEKLNLGIAIAQKNKETFFKLKGVIEELFKRIRLVDYYITERDGFGLEIKSDSKVIGYLRKAEFSKPGFFVSAAEIDLEKLLQLIKAEHEYRPLSKYPSIMRDISLVVGFERRIGEIMNEIQKASPKLIEDVDLIDEYISKKFKNKQSLAFRVVFQAKNRTLTDAEVDKEMKKITVVLQRKFNAEIR